MSCGPDDLGVSVGRPTRWYMLRAFLPGPLAGGSRGKVGHRLAGGHELGLANTQDLKTVEEATSQTLEAFTQKYSNPSYTGCLESPADLYQK